MKGIELLTHITDEQRDVLLHSSREYKRFARIYFEVVSVDSGVVTIKSWQLENKMGKYLSAKDLKSRVLEVFEGAFPDDYQVNVIAVPFKFLNVVDIDYINQKKAELNLSDVDLCRLLDVRPENMSRILSDKRGLTKLGKAAFYYLFKYLEK
jgi:hypothetical protein